MASTSGGANRKRTDAAAEETPAAAAQEGPVAGAATKKTAAAKQSAATKKSTAATPAKKTGKAAKAGKAAPEEPAKPAETKAAATKTAAAKTAATKAAKAPGKQPAKATATPPEKHAKKAAAEKSARPEKKSGAKKPAAPRAPAAPATLETGEAAEAAEAAAQPPARRAPATRPDEEPWTDAELDEIRNELLGQAAELRGEISEAEHTWVEQLRDSGEGSGDDQADAGTKTFEREHELSLASNTRELLAQVERALVRLDAGTYGICENCGNPIGKARLQAFPRATLCVTCKQREERR